jgi:hypothetical protein
MRAWARVRGLARALANGFTAKALIGQEAHVIERDIRWEGRLGLIGLALALGAGCAAMGDRAHQRNELTLAEQKQASGEDVLDERLQNFPYDHPDVLGARFELASSLVELGRFDEAAVQLDRILVVMSLGTDSEKPLLWNAQSLRAEVAIQQGDPQLARLLLRSVVNRLERVLPPDHPDLVRARGRLEAAMSAPMKK